MAFFISFDTTWSPTSNFLQHAWITWLTRGLYAGYRRVNLNTQIDDMFLESDIYLPNGTTFRIRPEDLDGIAAWIPEVNAKLNPGSEYFPEVGHNGNGNIEAASNTRNGTKVCDGGAIEYPEIPDTPLEFKKPLGTGTNMWPATPTVYDWTTACTDLDPLKLWWTNPANQDKFAHISHTFTHEEENNATYSDVYKEISFNIAWLNQTGISSAKRFTANGIIPPAITGLHNGDALRAWHDNGITNCVGDNTRPVLVNQQNPMHPYITTVESDGFAGMQVNGRWATRIYYNCDTPECTTQEWIDTSAGSGTFYDLLAQEKADTMRHLFGLYHDPYMFHQANLRNADAEEITINGVSAQLSIFQAWVETQVQEFVRLAEWPVVTLKHADVCTLRPSGSFSYLLILSLDVRIVRRPRRPRRLRVLAELRGQQRADHRRDGVVRQRQQLQLAHPGDVPCPADQHEGIPDGTAGERPVDGVGEPGWVGGVVYLVAADCAVSTVHISTSMVHILSMM